MEPVFSFFLGRTLTVWAVCVCTCVCLRGGVHWVRGVQMISDASYHIWVTAAASPRGVGGVRNWGFREEGNRQH